MQGTGRVAGVVVQISTGARYPSCLHYFETESWPSRTPLHFPRVLKRLTAHLIHMSGLTAIVAVPLQPVCLHGIHKGNIYMDSTCSLYRESASVYSPGKSVTWNSDKEMGDNASYIETEYGDENGSYMEQYRVQYRALVLVVQNLRFSLPHVYVVF